MKDDFLKYIGPKDSLAGYSRSYKLVLYKVFFLLMDSDGKAPSYKVAENFREFYANRIHNGLKPDINVDSRIENAERSSVQDVYNVIVADPLKHISAKGYLQRVVDEGQEQIALNPILFKELTKTDIEKIQKIVEKKLDLYFSKIDGDKDTMNLHDLLYKWMNEYAEVLRNVKEENDFKNPFCQIIDESIPNLMKELTPISEPYRISGSHGKGRWATVPWVAIFDSRITTSARKGIYIVYLLNKDTKTLYLTLNQGVDGINQQETDSVDVNHRAETNAHNKRTELLRINAAQIRESIGNNQQVYAGIDCGDKDYDAGTIYYKKYDLDTLPEDEQLLKDLREYIALYGDYYDKLRENEWYPTLDEYTPDISKEQWIKLLKMPKVFHSTNLKVIAQIYTLGGEASCARIAEEYGGTPDYYRMSIGVHLAERVHKETGCPLYGQENAKFWPVLFMGRKARPEERGGVIWRLRDELKAALEEIDVLKYVEDSKKEENMSVKDHISRIKAYIRSKGFTYEDGVVENFYLSLKTKPFVILAGTSGTGKTRLVRLFAEAVGATSENGRYKLVPVRPDWSDSTDLFGHVDLNGKFIPGAIIDFIKQAESDIEYPYFLCLDEMNLARVEYYLSDILSIIETREIVDEAVQSDPLISLTYYGADSSAIEDYGTLHFPENLYIIGTVNMDETTFPFSKKVLDRANTIEFSYVDLLPKFDAINSEPQTPMELENDFFKAEYLLLNQCAEERDAIATYCNELDEINKKLKIANAHVGYRVRDEIVFYLLYNKKYGLLNNEQAFDNELMQKILPRIQGSSGTVKTMLSGLFRLCAGDYEGYQTQSNDISDKMQKALNEKDRKVKYRQSATKIELMTRRFEEDGFTSYWL